MYTNFLVHYLKANIDNKNFKTYFKEKNYNKIAIYGFGTTGKLLYDEIKDEIEICCIIDKSDTAKINVEVEVIKPRDIINYENINIIIVTPYFQFYEIRNSLKKYTSTKILSLRNILSELKSEDEIIEISKFLRKKNVQLHLFTRPNTKTIENPSLYEQAMMFSEHKAIEEQYEYLKEKIFNDVQINIDYLESIYNIKSFLIENKETKVMDKKSEYCNIINSYRYIPDYPNRVNKKIYIFGDCSSFGFLAEDKRTAANILQKRINHDKCSYGIYAYASAIKNISYLFEIIKKLPLKDGDMILYIDRPRDIYFNWNHNYRFFYNLENIYEYDLTSFFSRPHNYGEIFVDSMHIANRGQMLLGDALYKCIKDKLNNDVVQEEVQENRVSFNEDTNSILNIKKSEKLNEYINYLKKEKIENNGLVGCIVMNCNPFTLGHLYLIEKACNYVDILYIFCVEEDTSIFKFKERFQLLVENTKHLKNVKILKSGKYILSSLTFNNYFTKESIQNITIDATYDLEIFCQYIVPILNISIRFAGTEPICKITSQYNRDMKHILPKYNIQFKEIERKKLEENVISATKVRDLIWKKDLEGISKLVPEKTLHFIEENISELIKRIKEK